MDSVHKSSSEFGLDTSTFGNFSSPMSHAMAVPLCDKKSERRFSYAEMLSEQSTSPKYDAYMPSSSLSPSNDSDDYQTSNSCSSPENDIKLAGTSSMSVQASPMAYVEPTPSVMTTTAATTAGGSAGAAVATTGAGAHPFYSMQYTGSLPPASHPEILSSVIHPLTMMPFQHRHSIAGPAPTDGSGFFHPARHNSFSHSNLYDHSNPAHTASTVMHSLAGMCLNRPVTPVSPMMPYTGQMFYNGKQDGRNLVDMDYGYGFHPQSSPFAMQTSSPITAEEGQRRHSVTRPKLEERKESKTPRSRGRRVSNVPSNGVRMFTCKADGCGKVFKRSEHLKRHIRSIHTLEKPFECPYHSCSKRFSRSDNLNQHIRIHRHSNAGTNDKTNVSSSITGSSTSSPTPTTTNLSTSANHETTNQHFSNFVQNYM